MGKSPVSDMVVHAGQGQGTGQQLARKDGREISKVAVEPEILHDETETILYLGKIKKDAV